jgi:hypothetical protein
MTQKTAIDIFTAVRTSNTQTKKPYVCHFRINERIEEPNATLPTPVQRWSAYLEPDNANATCDLHSDWNKCSCLSLLPYEGIKACQSCAFAHQQNANRMIRSYAIKVSRRNGVSDCKTCEMENITWRANSLRIGAQVTSLRADYDIHFF